jgi:hypothetical protein
MQQKQEPLSWIHKKIEFKDYIKVFTASEWKDIEASGFKTYCESKEYSLENGLGYLMALQMVKIQYGPLLSMSGNQHLFALTAKTTFDMIMSSMNQQMTSNMSAVVDWLGDRLIQKIERESNAVGTQVMDLLSLEFIRIALECLDSNYCANQAFANKDVRILLQNNQISFTQMLAIGKAIQKDSANRDMPAWITHDPELFNIALKCNDLQLNALSELKFDILPEKDSLIIVSILRAVILRMNGNVEYNQDMKLFKELVIDVVKKQMHMISHPGFIAHVNNFLDTAIPEIVTADSTIIEDFVEVYKGPVMEQIVSSNPESPLISQSMFKPSDTEKPAESKKKIDEQVACIIS